MTAVVMALAVVGVVVGRASTSKPQASKGIIDESAAEAFDDFSRNGDGRLRAAKAARWSIASGAWRIDDGAASAEPRDRPAVALVSIEGPDGAVEATMTSLTNGAGIVFRHEDEQNYWALTAAPDYATWNVERVVDGTSTFVGNTGLSSVDEGTVATVRMRGDLLEFLINGQRMTAIRDNALQNATRAGLIAKYADSPRPRWDRFAADGHRSSPTTTSTASTTTGVPQ